MTGLPEIDDDVPPDTPLTTREGWSAFVRHTPEPPTLLSLKELAAFPPRQQAAHEQLRRDYHADLPLVNTPILQKVISTGRLLVQLNRRQISARRGIVLSSASGTGKTTALTQFGRAHELAVRKRQPDNQTRIPVIYVTVPPAATSRMLAVSSSPGSWGWSSPAATT
ncbi:TniB family NTP-binding protein [Actinomadura sp. HBU206391]|uniref:TniB family NTP-binding protein n=1 Tax=Actinomadura sp. HBU206391 TaxID=2731692 RepID=UPI001C9D0ABC|nr:TniB family NTP-binding protein [Actinomadura sp. HBU206391]